MNRIRRSIFFIMWLGFYQIGAAQNDGKYAVKVNLYQPISNSENLILEDLITSQLDFYLVNHSTWEMNKMKFSESPKKIVGNLNSIVQENVQLQNYSALKDFKQFSGIVKKKIENIEAKEFYLAAGEQTSVNDQKENFKNHQISELLSILRTEIFVTAEKDMYVSTSEVYTDLTKEEKDQLIEEIENFKDGDMLAPISLSYEELKVEDTSGGFLGEVKESVENDFADRILDLLAQNNNRLERLESELSQLLIDGGNPVSSEVSAKDRELFNLLPESMNFYFYSGSSNLTTATLLQLNEIVEILAQAEKIKVVITGYADKSGSPSANLSLSKKRANAVKLFMKESGMAEERFVTNYYGEAKSGGYSNQDRRVEIKFYMN